MSDATMTRDDAKAIIDGGMKQLMRDGYSLGLAAPQDGCGKYLLVSENGAGGNVYVSNDFDTVWQAFNKHDTPISQVDYYTISGDI